MAVPISTAEMNPTLAKKLRKVLQMRLDTPEITTALTDISSFYSTNRPEHRRGLRAQLERRGVALHQRMLQAFEPVAAAVAQLDDSVHQIQESCEDASQRLRAVREQNEALIVASESIQSKREALAAKRELVGSFFEEIFLRPEEAAALREGPNDPRFFEALGHLQGLQSDNEVLLRVAKQRAGMEIMDQMAMQLEHAFELLYRWTIERFKEAHGQDGLEHLVADALVALKSRPALLDICLDEYLAIRKSVLLRQFLAALTAGGSGGMPRPIDMLAHEPTRFVGDMLAWVHEALAVESQLVGRLFEAKSSGGSSHSKAGVLSAILAELCGPILGRLKQALASQSVLLCFQVSGIVDFYGHTIGTKCIGEAAPVPEPMLQLSQTCRDSFRSTLQAHLDRLLRAPPPPNSDLTPAHSIAEVIAWAEQMASVCASSLLPEEHRAREFSGLMELLLEPLLRACVLSSQTRNTTDGSIFMLNSVCMLLAALAGHPFASACTKQLNARLDALVGSIVDEQSASLLRTGNLAEKIVLASSGSAPLCQAAGMEPGVLMESVRKFYHSVFGGNAVLMPQCDRIQVLQHRNRVRGEITARVVDGYSVLWQAVQQGGYEDPSLIAPHTPEQFSTLLQ